VKGGGIQGGPRPALIAKGGDLGLQVEVWGVAEAGVKNRQEGFHSFRQAAEQKKSSRDEGRAFPQVRWRKGT
jgi:hypothetical protein